MARGPQDRERDRDRNRNRNQARSSGKSSNYGADRETTISKALSYILRHGAKDMGLKMDERGFVTVSELLAQKRLRSLDVDLSALRGVVASNAKQRFELLLLGPADTDAIGEGAREDDPANYLIRATQGHSIKGLDAEALLTPVLVGDSDFPNEVVHGTYPAAWKAILESGGLKRMGRMHIHFATGVSDDDAVKGNDKGDRAVEGGREGEVGVVVSGMRASAGILVWVDVRRSIEGGDVRWWRSRNGVILTEGSTEGEGKGLLGLEYVSHVVDRRNGNVIWKNEWWEEGSGA